MQQENTRNTIIFIVLAAILMIGYQFLVLEPAAKRRQAEVERAAATAAQADPARAAPQAAARAIDRNAAAAASPRIAIDTPAVRGSLSLRGSRIDDLYLKNYRQTEDEDSPPVELLRPEGAEHAWFAEFGWTGANLPGLPTADTVWQVVEGGVLTPSTPVTLRYANGQGLTFTRRIAVDDRFMFTVTDTVANTSGGPVTLAPYGSIQRQGIPADLGRNQIVHEGAIGWLGDKLQLLKYNKWAEEGGEEIASTGGWAGITDKYWLTALVPEQDDRVEAGFRVTEAGSVNIYEANYVGRPIAIPAGRQVTETTRLFAGAKTVPLLNAYEEELGVPQFDQAVDWGNFWFLTRPMFSFLHFLFENIGNFGLAILALTVVVRLIFFPLANKSYESLTKMKKVQPVMMEIREKYKEDPAKQQQELLQLYQREKINPLTGCLPMLLQIPVFYALYKVLTVTIEMRHAPFFGWIDDLSAPDPTSIFNLFGLLPYDPASIPLIGGFVATLGVLALLYGFTMWLTMAMNPPAPDPVQQKMFQLMPIIFTFIMAGFASGLLIYWTWSNVLTLIQQYIIMRRFKVDNPIDDIIRRVRGGAKAV